MPLRRQPLKCIHHNPTGNTDLCNNLASFIVHTVFNPSVTKMRAQISLPIGTTFSWSKNSAHVCLKGAGVVGNRRLFSLYLWSGHGSPFWHGRNSRSQSLREFCRTRSSCRRSALGRPCDRITSYYFLTFLIAVPIIRHEGAGEAIPFILAHIQVQPFQRSQAADAGALVISVDVGAVLAAPARVSVDASHHSRVSVGASDRLRSGLPALGSRNWDAPGGGGRPSPLGGCCTCPCCSTSPHTFRAAVRGADSSHSAREAQGSLGLTHSWGGKKRFLCCEFFICWFRCS